MTFQGWYSEQDVIEDLMWATGKCVRDIDEHVLIGQEPPRPTELTCDEDTEMQMLRLNGGCIPMNPIQMKKPDLVGITKMIRMVDQFSDSTQEEPRVHTADRPRGQILSISKLNPDVQEFIPKNNCTLDSANSKPNKTDSRDRDSNLSPNNRIDKTQLTVEELKDMREKLKSKINTSNTACVRVKRERNLAIATLLNLYCKAPKSPENVNVKPTLITPEYYEKSIENNKENNDCNNTTNYVAECTESIRDEHVAASVEKVQKWFSASETNTETKIKNNEKFGKVKTETIDANQKVTPLYLGPVTFKRKAGTKTTSSTSSECDRAKTVKSTVFVPSAYASELTKTYMERSRLKESIANDLWMKVEMAIKDKESQKETTENDKVEKSTEKCESQKVVTETIA